MAALRHRPCHRRPGGSALTAGPASSWPGADEATGPSVPVPLCWIDRGDVVAQLLFAPFERYVARAAKRGSAPANAMPNAPASIVSTRYRTSRPRILLGPTPASGRVTGRGPWNHNRPATLAPRRRGRTRAAQPALAAPSPPAAQLDDPYILRGLLVCDGCGQRLCSLQTPEGRRTYRSPCGCRLRPVDAEAVEHRTVEAAMRCGEALAKRPGEVGAADWMRGVFIAIRVGATATDLSYVRRPSARLAAPRRAAGRTRRPDRCRPLVLASPRRRNGPVRPASDGSQPPCAVLLESQDAADGVQR